MADGIVIVGGSVAAVTAAVALRAEGFDGPVTMLTEERHAPYARPVLSKGVLDGSRAPDSALLSIEASAVLFRTGARAVGLDRWRRRVQLADGDEVPYDGLIVATGARARTMRKFGDAALSLRTLDDAITLRDALGRATRLVVIGGGLLGMEIASAARSIGVHVAVLDVAPPLRVPLGRTLADLVCNAARDAGAEIHVSPAPPSADDVRRLDPDLVVVAVGCEPNTEWLRAAGLGGARGVPVDDRCRAAARITAAGDVACAPSTAGLPIARTPHWASAVAQGQVAAAALVRGDDAPALSHQPYFWTEAFGMEIKVAGHPPAIGEPRVVDGSLEDGTALLQWSDRVGPTAAAAVNYRASIAALSRLARREPRPVRVVRRSHCA
jgi:3-phenylpropionate/trans-cinnamate dioxygenase ferredoxin reductase component